MHPYRYPSIPAIAVSGVIFLLTACASVNLSSVVDTQFLMGNRELPLQNVLVVFDSRDLELKERFETAFVRYIRENTATQAFRDIDLYSPLKKLSDKEKLWALKDQSIGGVLYMKGGFSDRKLRDWLYPEAPDIETETPAWQSGTIKLFLPATGQVVWIGSVADQNGTVDEDLLSRSFFGAVTSDLLHHGFLQQKRVENRAMPGFNR